MKALIDLLKNMRKRHRFEDLVKEYPDQPEKVFEVLKSEAHDKLVQLEALMRYAKWEPIDPWGDAVQIDGMCNRLNDWIIDQKAAQGKLRNEQIPR